MKFAKNDIVTVAIHALKMWDMMDIHHPNYHSFVVHDVRTAGCAGCAKHEQHLLIEQKDPQTNEYELRWASGSWFDPEETVYPHNHSLEEY